jgi:hypothetical protein
MGFLLSWKGCLLDISTYQKMGRRELGVAEEGFRGLRQGQATRGVGKEERQQRPELLLEGGPVQHVSRLLPASLSPAPAPAPAHVHGLLAAPEDEALQLLQNQGHALRRCARLEAQDCGVGNDGIMSALERPKHLNKEKKRSVHNVPAFRSSASRSPSASCCCCCWCCCCCCCCCCCVDGCGCCWIKPSLFDSKATASFLPTNSDEEDEATGSLVGGAALPMLGPILPEALRCRPTSWLAERYSSIVSALCVGGKGRGGWGCDLSRRNQIEKTGKRSRGGHGVRGKRHGKPTHSTRQQRTMGYRMAISISLSSTRAVTSSSASSASCCSPFASSGAATSPSLATTRLVAPSLYTAACVSGREA